MSLIKNPLADILEDHSQPATISLLNSFAESVTETVGLLSNEILLLKQKVEEQQTEIDELRGKLYSCLRTLDRLGHEDPSTRRRR